jgi:hypothetical protein
MPNGDRRGRLATRLPGPSAQSAADRKNKAHFFRRVTSLPMPPSLTTLRPLRSVKRSARRRVRSVLERRKGCKSYLSLSISSFPSCLPIRSQIALPPDVSITARYAHFAREVCQWRGVAHAVLHTALQDPPSWATSADVAREARLPIERPHLHQLILNLETAREIGVTFSPDVLNRADQLIGSRSQR